VYFTRIYFTAEAFCLVYTPLEDKKHMQYIHNR